MRKRDFVTIGDAIGRMLREEGLEVPLYEHRLLHCWQEVIPAAFVPYIAEVSIRNQTLRMKVRSSVARNELFLRRKELVASLNAHIGYQVISDIQFF